MALPNRARQLTASMYWAIGLIGLLGAIAWARTPFDLFPTSGQLERTQATGFLYGQEQFSQIVVVPHGGITAVQFWLLAHNRESDSRVILHVATPDDPLHDLATASVALRDIPAQPPVTFRLPLFNQDTTPTLVLTLAAPNLDRANAVSVLGSGNLYGGGTLLVNGVPRTGEDLAFQLLTPRTAGDLVLPLSRFTRDRTGIFGQPSLYIALLWGVLWAYGWMFVCIARWLVRARPRLSTSDPMLHSKEHV